MPYGRRPSSIEFRRIRTRILIRIPTSPSSATRHIHVLSSSLKKRYTHADACHTANQPAVCITVKLLCKGSGKLVSCNVSTVESYYRKLIRLISSCYTYAVRDQHVRPIILPQFRVTNLPIKHEVQIQNTKSLHRKKVRGDIF